MVVYLSQEWLDECRRLINEDDSLQKAARGKFSATFQHDVTGVPAALGGQDIAFYSIFEDGRSLDIRLGTIYSPEIYLAADYRTWERIHKGEAGMVSSALLGRLEFKVRLLWGMKLGLKYHKMFKMGGVIATIPTDFPG